MNDTVRLTEFGRARFESRLTGGTATVEDILREHNVERGGRRVAVNGHPAAPGAPVTVGDEITVVERVIGG